MSAIKVKMNPGWEKQLEAQIVKSPEWAKIQDQANETARSVVREVDEQMKGRDVEAIHAELISRISAAGITPNADNLREYAQSIADGTWKE